MPSRSTRPLLYLTLLAATLAAVLWLAGALERRGQSYPRQDTASSGPTFSPPGGAYSRSQTLHIRPSRPDAQVVFATGGHAPTLTMGTLYERPLLLDTTAPGVTVVRAREVIDGQAGPVASASYIVGVESALPILSIAADPADLWDAERGLLVNTWQRGPAWERPAHVTYVEGSGGFSALAGLRAHGSERFDDPKQSLRLYWRNEYGAARLEYPLFDDHPYQALQSFKRIVLQAGNRSSRWTLLEQQLVADVAADLGRHTIQGRSVLLFLNGEPWGIYRLSERIDRFFLEDNLGIRSADLLRDGDIDEGDDVHWNALLDWLATHDLGNADNLAYVETQIDVDDFTDYAILQLYFDLPVDRFDAARPRVGGGRWFWLYGDDGPDESLRVDAVADLLEPPADPGDLNVLWLSLLESPAYRARFADRAADLLNTTLSPQVMGARVDHAAAQIRPDIHHEAARWPTPLDWEQNVAALRDFARHRPDVLRQQIAQEMGLAGTAALTFDVSPQGGGAIFVNGAPTPVLPWTGVYFQNSGVSVIAVPAPGYAFSGWSGDLAQASTPQITITVEASRTLTARFAPRAEDEPALRPNDVIISEYWINDDGTRYSSLGNRPIEGDWVELLVVRPNTIDLRGWRITDNDAKTGTREGSIILPQLQSLAAVPRGTVILIVATESPANAAHFGQDDLDPKDGRVIFYVGNGNLDVTTDPGFGIGANDDNLALLAPGPSPDFVDDVGVDFLAEGDGVTPFSFGVLGDGVVFEPPFRGLGGDDGVIFTGDAGNGDDNDDGSVGWVIDPPAYESGDALSINSDNVVTPGAPNHSPWAGLPTGLLWPLLAGLAGVLFVAYLYSRRHG